MRIGQKLRVANLKAFVDAQRMRTTYTPGWFGEMELELRRKMLELERDLTKEVMAAHDVDAPRSRLLASCIAACSERSRRT